MNRLRVSRVAAAAFLLAACDPRPTPDVLGVPAETASPEALKAACNSTKLGFDTRRGADTVLENGARVRISPERGSHRIGESALDTGRVVARLRLIEGDVIPGWNIRTKQPVCLVMYGKGYDNLTTLFVSSEDGSTLARQPTQVIYRAKKHRRSEADWIAIGGARAGRPSPDSAAGGMIPWLWTAQNPHRFAAQVSCGRNQCCAPRREY